MPMGPCRPNEELCKQIRELEANLREQGITLFPLSRDGHRAHLLWQKINQHLFRGGAVQITAGVLNLAWHRQQLKRARQVLVEMELIKRRSDGLYVLGCYDSLDEEVRQRF